MPRPSSALICAALAALSPAAPAAAQSLADIVTAGSGHDARVDQRSTSDARVTIDQIGTATEVAIRQRGPGKQFEAALDGSDLIVDAVQRGDAPALLSVTSSGSGNRLDARQGGVAGGENLAWTSQVGIANHASLDQIAAAGAANEIRLAQFGNDNHASLVQNGSGNMLDLIQNGDANDAALRQSGTALALAVTQHGGSSIAIAQVGP